MSAGQASLQSAFVLHHRPYRDTSLLLELFTQGHGRLGAVARGARRPRARLRVLLQPLQPLLLSWSGRGELRTLNTVEPDGRAPALTGASLYSVFYMNELVLRLTARDDPHPRLFEAYRVILAGLGGAGDARLLRLFEKTLLEALGYGLNLVAEADTGAAVDPVARYRMDPEAGPRPAADTDTAVSGDSLLALAEGILDTPERLRDARHILRDALERHLGGRPLQTPRLMRALRQRRMH